MKSEREPLEIGPEIQRSVSRKRSEGYQGRSMISFLCLTAKKIRPPTEPSQRSKKKERTLRIRMLVDVRKQQLENSS